MKQWIVILMLAITPAWVAAQTISGKVVGVSDGDTITLLVNDHNQYKIRFAQLDAPEKNQPWGQKSKQALSDLVFQKAVDVQIETKDRYGRIVGTLFVNGINANQEQIKNGNAWVYRQYLKDQSLLGLEEKARNAKRGLWSLPEAQRMPPWEWRHGGSKTAKQASLSTVTATSGCADKRTCRQMTSCVEARHYLIDCGVKSLDGDNDGIPCTSLCK